MTKYYATFMDKAQDAVSNSKWADWPYEKDWDDILDTYLRDMRSINNPALKTRVDLLSAENVA